MKIIQKLSIGARSWTVKYAVKNPVHKKIVAKIPLTHFHDQIVVKIKFTRALTGNA